MNPHNNFNTERYLMPDLVRAVALIGIALVNVSVISYPLAGGYIHGGLHTTLELYGIFPRYGIVYNEVLPPLFIYVWSWICLSNEVR